MALRINSATLTPNPVNASTQYILSLELEEYTMTNIGLLDSSTNTIYDSSGNRLYVTNDVITSVSYVSAYSASQMDSFILSVLGV
jgi:DNA-binding beta-propeller fold protein YncE